MNVSELLSWNISILRVLRDLEKNRIYCVYRRRLIYHYCKLYWCKLTKVRNFANNLSRISFRILILCILHLFHAQNFYLHLKEKLLYRSIWSTFNEGFFIGMFYFIESSMTNFYVDLEVWYNFNSDIVNSQVLYFRIYSISIISFL